MRYTDYLEKSLFLWEEEDATEEMILEFLAENENFRTFGERLSSFICKKMPSDLEQKPQEYITQKIKEKQLNVSRNTIKSWFTEDKSRKSADRKEHMYMISFALELDEEETRELFTKVYFDRPFNVRDKREFVYLYCIRNMISYENAEKILRKLEKENFDKHTDFIHENEIMHTQLMGNVLQELKDENELISFIKTHLCNFYVNSQSIQIIINTLLKEILLCEDGETYLERECEMDPLLLKSGVKSKSYSNMLTIITGVDLVKAGKLMGKSIYKSARFPKEIMNRFPTKHTFSKWDRWYKTQDISMSPTTEELRKMLILLFSYRFWFQVQYEKREEHSFKEKKLEVYMDELNDLLVKSNLQPLYYGNPFDWIFLYCTLLEEPLTGFRFLYDEVYVQE